MVAAQVIFVMFHFYFSQCTWSILREGFIFAKLRIMDAKLCENKTLAKWRNHFGIKLLMKVANFQHLFFNVIRVKSNGSVVECLTRDRRAAGSSLTGVTALCP